jgi:dCMP deaminase
MNWDLYFHGICESISAKSPCLSRKIGAIIVKDHSILSTGYNGPARGIPHCGADRWEKDEELVKALNIPTYEVEYHICPRKTLGFKSGEGMRLCPAQHAEENAVSNAARIGVNVWGSTLYLNSVVPCKNCFSTLINAGIMTIVCESITLYDQYSKFIINNSDILVREFNFGRS